MVTLTAIIGSEYIRDAARRNRRTRNPAHTCTHAHTHKHGRAHKLCTAKNHPRSHNEARACVHFSHYYYYSREHYSGLNAPNKCLYNVSRDSADVYLC